MTRHPPSPDLDRLHHHAAAWHVELDETRATPAGLVAFGTLDGRPVVLKAARRGSDEWRAGEVAAAFGGEGMVRVLARAPGAALLERLVPGRPLAELVLAGDDERATAVLADLLARMRAAAPVAFDAPPLAELGRSFERWLASGDASLERGRVAAAAALFGRLVATQERVRLLHGDLQHTNVLWDARRGWTAIDPKGVLGEDAYEAATALRNPPGRPELWSRPEPVLRRAEALAAGLGLDPRRILEWAVAQGMLSALWTLEDTGAVDPACEPGAVLAEVARGLLDL